jgi:hypothetical protein
VLALDGMPWFRGQARQWVSFVQEDGYEEMRGSADKMLMTLKWLAKMFSRTDQFVGLFCITGPPGGGKGTVLATAMAFGGKMCHNIGHGYLFDDKIRTSEDCRPVLAGLAGKAIGYSDEYPDKVMNAETVKPLICARGGAVSARFGGARDTQATSIEVTATLFGVGNQALRLKPGVVGLAEKIYQLTPDFLFKNVGAVMGPGDVPHDETFARSITAKTFAPEYFYVMRRFFKFVDDARVVKGRDWWPIPAGVRGATQQLAAACCVAASAAETLGPDFLQVKNARGGDNTTIVAFALELRHHANVEHALSAAGVVKGAARSRTGASLFPVYMTGTVQRRYLRVSDALHAEVLARFGDQKARRSKHTTASAPGREEPPEA